MHHTLNRFVRKAVPNELLPLNIYIDLIDCIAEVIIYIFRHLNKWWSNHLIAHCLTRFRFSIILHFGYDDEASFIYFLFQNNKH